MKIALTLILLSLITSCSLIEVNSLAIKAKDIRIFLEHSNISKCTFVSDIIGSEGYLYNFLFIANKNLVNGAMNDLKNQASLVDADSIYVQETMLFATSVTIYGQAYQCRGNEQ